MDRILTFGVFDYFHIGHLRLFKQCKNYGDYLIVAVQNGDYILKYKPDAQVLYTTEERVEILDALKIVDEVVVYDRVAPETLKNIDFDILALGEDHVGKRFQEIMSWCERHDRHVVRLKRTPNICSSSIKEQVKESIR